MKINEVIIKEFDTGGYDPMGNVTTGEPSASPTAVAAPAPAPAGQAKWPTTKDEIIAFQKANGLKADGLIGQKTMAALNKAGAKAPPGFKPVPNRKKEKEPNYAADVASARAADAAQQAASPDPNTTQDPSGGQGNAAFLPGAAGGAPASNAMAPAPAQSGPEAPSAELDRLKQLAIGQNTLNQQASQQGAAMSQAAKPDTNPLGVTAQAGGVFGQPAPEADKPNTQTGQAAQPDTAQTNPDTGLSTAPKPVTTGTGGKTNMVTGSDDEMAWRQKNPNWNMTGAQYPGPGNWDPKTGRSKKDIEQGQKNWDAIKGFFGGGKKQPAAPAPNQGAQPAPAPAAPSTLGELTDIQKLAGLK